MFNIFLKQAEYLTYILEDQQNHSRLEVVPERGGIITQWKVQGQDILYLDKERFKNPQLSIRGGIPILFPICGNLPNNIFFHKEQEYQLKQHGFARDLPWQVIAKSTGECAKIVLSLKSNQQTLEVYPFEFELIFSYELKGNQLVIAQSYENKSEEIMLFSAGFHPYFWCTDKSKLKLNIPANQYRTKIGEETYPFDNNLDYNQEEIDIAFTELNQQTASFSDQKRNLTVSLNYSDFFSTLVFWTLKDKEYICLEPWSSPRNSINTKEKINYLEPGKTYLATFTMTVS
jgi:galactose mutarotase-like enzyme